HGGHLGRAVEDLGAVVTTALATVSAEDAKQSKELFTHAVEAVQGQLEAIHEIRSGHFGHAAEAMGRGLTAAGQVVAVADPEIGQAISGAGTAIQQQAPFAERTAAELKAGNFQAAARDTAEHYIEPAKTALLNAKAAAANAREGRFG